ncbi:MAG: serpin family protein [Planctomycetota bacterium]|nr:serpin family protein [Planctomycetota bacterium]
MSGWFLLAAAAAVVAAGIVAVLASRDTGGGRCKKLSRVSAIYRPGPPKDIGVVAKAVNAFGLDLYGRLRESDKTGNLFFSPCSIATALTMTSAGARGETERQMAEVLRLEVLKDRRHEAFGEVVKFLNAEAGPGGKKRGFELSAANRLFGQKGYGFLPDFLALNEKTYGASLEAVDFAGATEAARKTINDWVEDRTRGKIKDLVPPGGITPLTRLVLTNAICFKGLWALQFKKENTREMPFELEGGARTNVPAMYQKAKEDDGLIRYGEVEGRLQMLDMPYVGNEISMTVLLPAKGVGLGEVEKELTVGNLQMCMGLMLPRTVEIYLPRFRMTWGTRDLVPELKTLGMRDAFDDRKADFSGIEPKKELFIKHVFHKAFVDVNEEGTEAAAATAVVMALKAVPRVNIFRADRPFLFLIRERTSGLILFIGRVMDPRAG